METSLPLSVDQRRLLDNGDPVRVHDAGVEFVILRADVYERIKTLVSHDDDWTAEELRVLAARTVEDADSAGPIP